MQRVRCISVLCCCIVFVWSEYLFPSLSSGVSLALGANVKKLRFPFADWLAVKFHQTIHSTVFQSFVDKMEQEKYSVSENFKLLSAIMQHYCICVNIQHQMQNHFEIKCILLVLRTIT